MKGFKEFQGKDLDCAIEAACEYFNTTREKLEIEIVQDAKSGIFGIVGARKAKVRARRAQLRETIKGLSSKETTDEIPKQPSGNGEKALSPDEPDRKQRRKTPAARQRAADIPPEQVPAPAHPAMPEQSEEHEDFAIPGPDFQTSDFDEALDEYAKGQPTTPMGQMDAERLQTLTMEAVRAVVCPIVGDDIRITLDVGKEHVSATVDGPQDSGLLIGREGQTLAAVQYIVSRIVSRGMNAAVRVQLDADDYRRRQEERLRDLAAALAEKVRRSGRAYSTRPLSSYHRRIVHLCLQDDADVQTRSTGDGPMKQVVIMRKKTEK
ncbi:MAG: Jag N-terminal domain-containing protein [Desulfovibrio sp.]|jgi:spoIIIJ-associated protein|nr:Jag N-terminal domain-containing protein [Desulfovibrio sp.]